MAVSFEQLFFQQFFYIKKFKLKYKKKKCYLLPLDKY